MNEEPAADRLERVLAVVDVARRIADPRDALGAEARALLAQSISLSPQGIELALSEYLETDPSLDEISALVSESRTASCCHVVLSPSVCVAAHRATALAVAAAPEVRVKPSRRDPTLARLFVRELSRSRRFVSAGGAIQAVARVDVAEGEIIHAYGADETLRSIARAIPQGATLIGHGAGFGIALVDDETSLEAAAAGIARDAMVFDQRGCLSPRLVLVRGDAERASHVGQLLDRALEGWQERVPRGEPSTEDATEISRYIELMRSVGEVFVGSASVVGVDPSPETLWIGPAFRVLHVVPVDVARVDGLLSAAAPLVTAVGGDEESLLMRIVHELCPEARFSRLGFMQKPPFDGPVDGRDDAWFSR